jgi:hypothetical protein
MDPVDLHEETAMNPTPATPAGAETPKPMPFAIMRNAHEALRASIRLQGEALESGDTRAFADEWRRLRRGLAVHMAMEDDAMFALLDEASGGAISAAGLPAEHNEDTRLAASVDAASTGSDLAALRFAWLAWRDEHLRHLEHEETVMMPLTMKTAPTPEGRARIVHDRLLTPSAQGPDFDWFVGWVVTMLSRHGSSSQSPAVATRVFAWGLQHASSPAQWRRWRPIVEQSCPPGMWDELAAGFDLDADGKIA